jgi:hypothetical protein
MSFANGCHASALWASEGEQCVGVNKALLGIDFWQTHLLVHGRAGGLVDKRGGRTRA